MNSETLIIRRRPLLLPVTGAPGVVIRLWMSLTRMKNRGLARHLLLGAVGLLMVFPFMWMISGALKTNAEIFASPLALIPPHLHWQTFVETLHSAPFARYIVNSAWVALATTVLVIANSALFAYCMTQLQFRGRMLCYLLVMASYMLPGAVTYIPAYIILAKLQLLNSHVGLILSNTVSVFGVFYLRQVFSRIHPSLIEAARIDGASEVKILTAVLLPQCKPALATLFLITFITNYNSYMWPSLVLTDADLSLIATGIRQYFISQGHYGLNWSHIMAACTLAVLPLLLLFVLCQHTILSSIAGNGVKE